MNSFRGKILVIRGGAIGDFILTLPALAALRRQFPEARVEVLGYPHIVKLAVAGGLADHAESIEARSLAGYFARGGELAEGLADYFSEFDLIVSYLYDPDDIFRTNVGRCTGAQFIKGPHRPNEKLKVPASQVYLKPLERLAIFDADPVPRLELRLPVGAAQGHSGGGRFPAGSVLALHPGSGSERKNWPEANWAELLQRLMYFTELNLLVLGGEAEGERLQRLTAALPPARVRVAQSLPLDQLAHALARCDLFVGHDSGISHLAAALGLKAVILWGETVEEIWRPLSDKVVLVRHPAGVAGLPVEEVFGELARQGQFASR